LYALFIGGSGGSPPALRVRRTLSSSEPFTSGVPLELDDDAAPFAWSIR
jgi:hypothetical protein